MLGLQPRALIFDLDGLMIDSEPLWQEVERAIAARYGHEWSEAQFRACIGAGLRNAARTMCRTLALPVDGSVHVRGAAVPHEDQVLAALIDGFVVRAGELALKPGCRELVDAAKAAGLGLAVASSSTLRLIDAVLEAFALRSRFSVVVSGDMVPHTKPAPDVFLRAAELLVEPPDRCVVLEDSLAGVRAAVAAGMVVIAVPDAAAGPPSDELAALADHLAGDLHEARRLLGL